MGGFFYFSNMNIVPLQKEQLSIVAELAYEIWPTAYGEILSSEQLQYMLAQFYSLEALETQFQNGQHFLLLKDAERAVGFLSYELNCYHSQKLKIHKIYVLSSEQGKGLGKLLIDKAIEIAIAQNQKAVFLNVNKYNKARFFYEKLGFTIVKEEVIEIGNGYVMDDYVMEVTV
ncbi:putative acetyltransferase [Flavobacteria bacterium BAL38]|nr:putative acetyltransferase [Flavobacteria bacterium BAL38]